MNNSLLVAFRNHVATLAFNRLQVRNAIFTLAYRNLGASRDGGSTHCLRRLIGYGKALELAMLPDRFDAATALRAGLVNWLVPPAELAHLPAVRERHIFVRA
jgi:2-(1,2-epoxy-1,2-dihydrophenyl)acetyl-CoA isomerase